MGLFHVAVKFPKLCVRKATGLVSSRGHQQANTRHRSDTWILVCCRPNSKPVLGRRLPAIAENVTQSAGCVGSHRSTKTCSTKSRTHSSLRQPNYMCTARCKAKNQYLLTLRVSRYCFLALQSIVPHVHKPKALLQSSLLSLTL